MQEVPSIPGLLFQGQQALVAHMLGESVPGAGGLLAGVYRAGSAHGLTEKEITRELLRPVRVELRPGLKRRGG